MEYHKLKKEEANNFFFFKIVSVIKTLRNLSVKISHAHSVFMKQKSWKKKDNPKTFILSVILVVRTVYQSSKILIWNLTSLFLVNPYRHFESFSCSLASFLSDLNWVQLPKLFILDGSIQRSPELDETWNWKQAPGVAFG